MSDFRPTMHRWRLTKYDPALRDPDGHYRRREWTSISDIGRDFGGEGVLTHEAYAHVESAHIDTVLAFLRESGMPTLIAHGVEDRRSLRESAEPEAPAPREGEAVLPERLPDIIRGCLRERCWCRLEAVDGGSYVHFGYDYYVYVGSRYECASARELARRNGLFVEDFASPHSPA